MRKIMTLGIMCFLVMHVFVVGCQSAVPTGKAPDFTLPDLEGNDVAFADLRGQVIVLDFWATWCPPCRSEVPHFNELYQQYKDQGLAIIGVALDQGGAKAVRPFVEKEGVLYPVLVGTQDVTELYGGVRGIPTTFVIDREGNIIEKFVGYRDKATFENVIKPLL